MTLTNTQWKARLSIRPDKIKVKIKEALNKEGEKRNIVYNENDTIIEIATKINNR